MRTALVTGAAAGIGRAIAMRLAQDGMAVGVLDINLEGCQKVVAEIEAAGGKAIALQASVADRPQVVVAVDKLRKAFGPVTVVVNNAGVAAFIKFQDLTDAEWDRTMDINHKGTFIVTQTVLPDMEAAKWGRIINISSTSAITGTALMTAYSSSKGAMIVLTRSLALELGPLGITVNNIAPGSVMNTIMSEANLDEAIQERLRQTLPVRRTGQPEDLANAVSFVASEKSSYITGQTIAVNGGRSVS